ncbi:hypothetical protein M407DRAFT_24265 [Tulasnella calospora MUT 4182]|uniref:Uncharacterized protein n=1 Tax=Tulasnella calospora MUT 4182 TaxID=1051891 RepID=A0A0C3QI52_9AGAM|nr:hypothetical protein M407DRAFT_24265 [Tulasnella calospora MUT 4182]
MAAKNGRVAENILREQTLEREFTMAGGTVTDGINAQSRLNELRVPVDAAGRSPSSLIAAASSSPLTEEDRFLFRRGPPQTPTRTPSHLSTVAQPQGSRVKTSHLTAAPARPPQTLQPSASASSAQQTVIDVDTGSCPPNVGSRPPDAGSRPPNVAEEDCSSFHRGPPQTPNRTPSHLSTVPQPQDAGFNTSHLTVAPARPPQTLQPSASTNGAQRRAVDVDAGSRPPNVGSCPPNSTQGKAATTGQRNAPSHQVPLAPRPPTASLTMESSAPPLSSATLPPALPTPPVQHGRSTASEQNLRDSWAQAGMEPDRQKKDAPVRVEVRKYEDFNDPFAPTSVQYLNVPLVSRQGGGFSCKLSDILGPLSVIESPLKERTSRIYRVGPLAELVTLGNGSDVTNPGSTQLLGNPFINTHDVERTEWNGMELFTGVKIFYEQRPMRTLETGLQVEDQPERLPPRQPRPPTRAKHSTITGSSTSGKKRSRRQRSPSATGESNPGSDSPPFDPEDEFYPFLRRLLALDPKTLPGQWHVKTARDALNRHLAVTAGVKATEAFGWRISSATELHARREGDEGEEIDIIPIPEAIRGLSVTKHDLQRVFGFSGDTTWWTLDKRWSKKELKGAKTVLAWVENPDAMIANEETGEEEERFPHLNRILFNKLKSVVALDKAGKYTWRMGLVLETTATAGGAPHYGPRGGDRIWIQRTWTMTEEEERKVLNGFEEAVKECHY